MSSSVRVFVLGVLLGLPACHPAGSPATDRLLVGEVMLSAELAANLRELCVPGGRLSGTHHAEQAEEFVARKLRAYGLEQVWFEPYPMDCWTVHETRVTLLTDPPRELEGPVALGNVQSTPPGGTEAELLYVGELREPGDITPFIDALPGRLAVVTDAGLERRPKLQLILEHGGAGMLVMRPPDRLPVIGNGHPTPRPEPAVVIPHDAELVARLEAGERVQARVVIRSEFWAAQPRNVVAEIPGRGRWADEIVVLCAHLDSWHLAEGALDNGTGSAAILEAARALAAADWRPHRTVRFVWFMGEEFGLRGSRAYVQAHADELDQIVAVVNSDMPGRPRRLVSFGHAELEPFLETFCADLAGFELEHGVREATGMWSDHAPFMRAGVATLSMWGDMGPNVKYYHTTGDTYEMVDRPATIAAAAVYAVLVRRLADLPERPSTRQDPVPDDGS